MRVLKFFVVPALLCVSLSTRAQSATDLQTLADLKTASKQMDLEGEGVTPFRLDATFNTNDFMGRPDNQGHWTEEFAKPGYSRQTVRESASPENYAPEDQVNMAAPAPTMSGTFMQRMLIDAMLQPGPTDATIQKSKVTYKSLKAGTVSLRCVVLEPLDGKSAYEKRTGSRAYCLAADKPLIRLSELAYGMTLTYNSIAHFGGSTFAQQVSASQHGKDRGKLQVTKMVAAPELLQSNLPHTETPVEMEARNGGAVKLDSGVAGGQIITKVPPAYPLSAKAKHITGTVLLHAIISKEGKIESLDVISAPSDDLAESAVDAVSQWIYKPYLLNGQPTEVDTTVTVHYTMG